MKLAIKILGIYTILIVIYSIVVNFWLIGKTLTLNTTMVISNVVALIPVIVLAILAIIYTSRK